jgi:methylenetetrahydrofolate reductase (NADPH)
MKIRDLFPLRAPTFSFEFFPPKTVQEVEELFVRARELKPFSPSFISVTYGAGGSTRRNTIDLVCRFQEELGILGMAHITCVGHSQTELREVLTELKERGIENLMCLRGDPPKGQTDFIPAPDGFAYAAELVSLARSVQDFCIGVAGYPEPHPECGDKQQDLENLKAKVDHGADFVTTQLFFDIVTTLISALVPVISVLRNGLFPASCRLPTIARLCASLRCAALPSQKHCISGSSL